MQGEVDSGSNSAQIRADMTDFLISVDYFPSQSQIAVNSNTLGPSEVQADLHSATLGSSNTTVVIANNVRKNVGAGITYATSATLGDSYTINQAGVYCMGAYATMGSAKYLAISVNGTGLSTDPDSLTYATGLRGLSITQSTNQVTVNPWCGNLNVNDVVRLQATTSPAFNAAVDLSSFWITQANGSQGAPILVGSVTSSGAAAYHSEALSGVCSSSASIGGSTLGTAPTTGNISSGCCTVTFPAGEFSATPFIVSGLSASSSLSTVVESSCSSSTSCTVCDSVGGTTTFNYQSMLMGTH